MNAPTRAEWVRDMRYITDRIEADESIPLPAWCWALPFRAGALDREGLKAIGASLGAEDVTVEDLGEEDCLSWYRLRGHVGAVPVEVTADGGPVLLDPPGEPEAAWSLAGGLVVNR
jgi:hypothetical protein